MNSRCVDCFFRVECLITPGDVCYATMKGALGLVRGFCKFRLTRPAPIAAVIRAIQRFLSAWGRPDIDYRRLFHHLMVLSHQGEIKIFKDAHGSTWVEPNR